jgi:hypothetical protein
MTSERVPPEEFLCATPTLELVRNEKTLSQVLQTHVWNVEKAEVYADGFLTRIKCLRCGLKRTAIISNIADSAKSAKELRQKRSQRQTDLLS